MHSSIPLAAKTIEEIGKKTGAWATTITYDAADINEQNLKQYDAIFLASTTGAFLDDPNDAAATAARRKALLDFVRGGKGLAGIHAASDSYHRAAAPRRPARGGRGGGGAAGGSCATARCCRRATRTATRSSVARSSPRSPTPGSTSSIPTRPARSRRRTSRALRVAVIARARARQRERRPRRRFRRAATRRSGTWPEFNKMIGGFFKFHWLDPQLITVKIDDPKSPLTAMFHGQEFEIHDETYTFGMDTYSRENLHVLTSIDYAKMSDEDKAKEAYPRADHDYALSWIRRDGKGRVFYEAHGHNERNYAIKPLLEHVLAGMQYALGDLKADDTPSAKAGTK